MESEFEICISGTCGFRRYLPGIDGVDGRCDACAAMDNEHLQGQHSQDLDDCPACSSGIAA